MALTITTGTCEISSTFHCRWGRVPPIVRSVLLSVWMKDSRAVELTSINTSGGPMAYSVDSCSGVEVGADDGLVCHSVKPRGPPFFFRHATALGRCASAASFSTPPRRLLARASRSARAPSRRTTPAHLPLAAPRSCQSASLADRQGTQDSGPSPHLAHRDHPLHTLICRVGQDGRTKPPAPKLK